ncbi:MAG: DUF1013 domain-containing protein, partial [Hyphomicrobium sp.]
ARRIERDRKDANKGKDKAGTLLSTEETTAEPAPAPGPTASIVTPKPAAAAREETPEEEQARVFAKLKEMSSAGKDDAESGADE